MTTDADWVEEVRRWLRTSTRPADRHEAVPPATGADGSAPAGGVKQQQGEAPSDASSSNRTPS